MRTGFRSAEPPEVFIHPRLRHFPFNLFDNAKSAMQTVAVSARVISVG